MLEIPLVEIDDTDRQRVNMQDLDFLATSIEQSGLITAITVVTHPDPNSPFKYKLIGGGRRMAAHRQLAKENDKFSKIKAYINEDVGKSPLMSELLENVARASMTWQEEAITLYKAIRAGEHKAFIDGVAFTQAVFGKLIGVSAGKVSQLRKLGDILVKGVDKEIIACSTQLEALQLLARREKTRADQEAMSRRAHIAVDPLAIVKLQQAQKQEPTKVAAKTYQNVVLCRGNLGNEKTIAKMLEFKPSIIFTDIPFGIDMSNLVIRNKEVKDAHDVAQNVDLFQTIFSTANRVLPEHGAFLTFADLIHFEKLVALGEANGFRSQRWPVILNKGPGGMNQNPGKNTTKNYEVLVAFYKKQYTLAVPGASSIYDWSFANGEKELFTHEFSKPSSVVQALATTFIKPDSKVLDFCCGQGSVVKALADMGHTVMGVDIEQSHINHAVLSMPECLVWNKKKEVNSL